MVNPRLINLAVKLGSEVLPKQEDVNTAPDPVAVPKATNTKEYIILENIICRDSNGKHFEQYPQLFVRKDIERDADQQQINHTPSDWVQYFEDKGLFLPSFALSCNILQALYTKRNDSEISKVLMQYKDKGNGTGWHAQNTIVDWGANRIIHYPSKNSQGGSINTGRITKELPFTRKGIKDMALENALKNEDFKAYIQNLTGLTKPEILVDIGEYFGKPAHIWTSSGKEVRAAWLGCGSGSFNLDTSDGLDSDSCRSWGTRQKIDGVNYLKSFYFFILSSLLRNTCSTRFFVCLWSGPGLHAPSP